MKFGDMPDSVQAAARALFAPPAVVTDATSFELVPTIFLIADPKVRRPLASMVASPGAQTPGTPVAAQVDLCYYLMLW